MHLVTCRQQCLLTLAILFLIGFQTIAIHAAPRAYTCGMVPNLPADISPNPNYLMGGGEAAAIQALNNARDSLGLPAIDFPTYNALPSPREKMLYLLNRERQDRGLPPLTLDATLSQIALGHARQMVDTNVPFDHNSPLSGSPFDRMKANPSIGQDKWALLGEDIAGNPSIAGALYEFVYNDAGSNWTHRENVFNCFDRVGINYAHPSSGSYIYNTAYVLDFMESRANYVPASADTAAPQLTITSPANGAVVSSNITVQVKAEDNAGIRRVVFFLDPPELPAQRPTAPYLANGKVVEGDNGTAATFTGLSVGIHRVAVYALDTSNNYAMERVTFMVDQPGGNTASAFKMYYNLYDGWRTLGRAISSDLIRNGYPAQYYEKAVLEDHASDTGIGTDSAARYQYGLLVDELHQARVDLPVGGDTSSVTYATINDLAAPAQRVSPPEGYGAGGIFPLKDGSMFVPFSATLNREYGHVIPGYFWQYMNRPDLFPRGWLNDIGLPITEAVQATVTKNYPTGTVQRTITIQAFQRTILTYDPANPSDWQIERGNTGSDYKKAFAGKIAFGDE